MKIALACSAGGHLTELLQLEKAWKGFPRFFVSDARENALELSKKEKVFFLVCPRRNPLKLVWNFFQALHLYLKKKPDVVITTGADTAIPFSIIAKLFGSRVLFIESFARIKEPSLSAKIMRRFSDVFLVQWPENLKFFPNARFEGSVF